jgi:uncharacterized protein YcfJ
MRIAFAITLVGAIWFSAAQAQNATLSEGVGVFVFPADGQDAAQQSRDEAECYNWAVDRTGAEPFELARRAERESANAERAAARAQQAGRGSTAGDALAGAATGALIGRVFGSKRTSRSAARAGAITGSIAGSAQRQATQAREARSAAMATRRAEATEAQIDNFRKAFSTCLEANDYVARF